MRLRHAMQVVLAAVAVLVTVTGAQAAARPLATAAPLDTSAGLRVLIVGDSIARGIGSPTMDGYRADLTSYLVDVGQIPVTMHGSLLDGLGRQTRHEGRGGWRIDQVTAELAGWVTTHNPDVVLVTAGTNDALQGATGWTMHNRMRALIGAALNADPAVRVIVADGVPTWGSPQRDTASLAVRQFNALLPGVVASAGPRATLARMSLAVPNNLLADGTHPDAAGYHRMAWVWWTCLGPLLAADGVTRAGRDPLPAPIPQSTLCLD